MSTNERKLEEYRIELVTKFNNLRLYIGTYHDKFSADAQQRYAIQFDKLEEKVNRCFNILQLEFELPNRFEPINVYLVRPRVEQSEAGPSNKLLDVPEHVEGGSISPLLNLSIDSDSETEHTDPNLNAISNLNRFHSDFPQNTNNIITHSAENLLIPIENAIIISGSTPNLNQTNFEDCISGLSEQESDLSYNSSDSEEEMADKFLSLCGSQINKPYEGDPLQLASFVNTVKLLQGVQGDNAATLLLFVKSKLSGKALEAIDNTANTVDLLIQQLEASIKPENSKVIIGRLAALRFNQSKSQEFSKEAESLAEALQRTLILEGMTKAKACEETIEKTVELCRQTTHSDVVRSIMGAASFGSPQEVISKFIVENTKDKNEKQVLAFRSQQQRQRVQNRGRGNFRGNGQNQRYQNNRNYNNRYDNNGGNWRGQNRGRGRGRGRGNYNNNYGNGNAQRVNYLENQAAPPPGAQQVSQIQAEHQ